MEKEIEVKNELSKKFGLPDENIVVQRDRRLFAVVPAAKFAEIFSHVTGPMKFEILCTVTGTDEGANFGVIYHVARQDGTVLNIKILIPRENPLIKTITDKFPAAALYERELWDLLGIKIEGLPEGKRYPLPDDWPASEYPLRKDWKPKTPPATETSAGRPAYDVVAGASAPQTAAGKEQINA